MKKIPIVFSFNDNYLIPAGVCVTSLLHNADSDTFYDIYVLHSSERLSLDSKKEFLKLKEIYSSCEINFVDLKEDFKSCYETRGVSIDTYYRLRIPKTFPNLDKVIYSDVDIIFNTDISDLFSNIEDNKSIIGVKDNVPSEDYLKKNNLVKSDYINAGFLIINNKEINNKYPDNYYESVLDKKFLYQDQDMINILFKGDIGHIDARYNYTFLNQKNNIDIESASVIHYIGAKPWNKIVPFGDLWWQYFRKSIFYNPNLYNKYTDDNFDRLNEYILFGKILHKTPIPYLLNGLRKWLVK